MVSNIFMVHSVDFIPEQKYERLLLKSTPTRILMLSECIGEFQHRSGQNVINMSSLIYLQRKIWRLYCLFLFWDGVNRTCPYKEVFMLTLLLLVQNCESVFSTLELMHFFLGSE